MDLKSIEAFLVSALTEDELRRLCAHLPGGAALALAIPGHGVPFGELAHQAVVMLRRQRRLDAAFFDGLRELVPERTAEVRALTDGASPQAPSAPPLACVSLRLGHVPSREEEASWALAQQDEDCEALRVYLTRWPAGAFAGEALARVNGRSVSAETQWEEQPIRLPMTVRGGALFEEEDALLRAAASAEQSCEPLRMSPMRRVLGSSAAVNDRNCALIERRWRCGFDGAAVCRVEIGRSSTVER